MFSKVIKRLQFVTAVWSPKHLQLAELWSPFFSPGPESVCVCMQIKVMYKQIFYCSLWEKKKKQTEKNQKKTSPQTKRKEKSGAPVKQEVRAFLSTYFRTALLQLLLLGFPQWPHQLSYLTGQGECGESSPGGSFQRWKVSACPAGKLQKDGREAPDPQGRAKMRSSGRPSPFLLEPSQIQHVDTPSPYLFFCLPREGRN